MKEAIIIFTRSPIPGHTKTRLEGCLSKKNCAELHKNFIKDIYNTCVKTKKYIFIFYTPERDVIKNIIGEYPIYYPQIGDNLGEKMWNAINKILNIGYDSCVLIGTDIPSIKEEYILNAFSLLKTNDVVFGPTLDKGYYLVAMKKAYREVFSIKVYGTGDVLENTIKDIEKIGLKVSFVKALLDIDEENDLLMLKEDIESGKITNCPYTAGFLKYMGSNEEV